MQFAESAKIEEHRKVKKGICSCTNKFKIEHEKFDIYDDGEAVISGVDSSFLCIMNGKTSDKGMFISPFSIINDGCCEMVL